jgi:uncharacterized SAM-binding protein YcdF (DUF218 family)
MGDSKGTPSNSRGLPVPKILLISVLVSAAVLSVLAFTCPQIIAEFLTARDPLERADFIYLLGGDYEQRSPVAALLFQLGWSPLIVITREQSGSESSSGAGGNFTDITRRILYANGVPAAAVLELIPATLANSTADEARALRTFIDSRPARSLIIVTSPIHCRRARMMMRRILRGRNVDVRVEPAEQIRPASADEIRKEFAKYLYYSLTFW